MRTKAPKANNTADIAAQISTPRKKERSRRNAPPHLLLPSGSTLMNLMCSDTLDGAYAVGSTTNIIGDSSSGKTFSALTSLAEAAYDKRFAAYKLIYGCVEPSMDFDLEFLFGRRFVRRLRIEHPRMIIDWQSRMRKLIEGSDPFIYVLDSLDALDTIADKQKADDELDAYEKGKEVAGTYAMAKAKKMSETLRRVCGPLEDTESMLIIISQVRDNIGFGFEKQRRSGGRALKFYSAHELWMSCGKPIKVRNQAVGINARVKCKKNKTTGKHRTVDVSFLYDYGLDDIGSCVDFLVGEKGFKKASNSSTIAYEPWKVKCSRAKLVQWVEDEDMERPLRELVRDTWQDREVALRTNRKQRF